MNKFARFVPVTRKHLGAIVAAGAALPMVSHAALPAGVETAIESAGVDGAALGGVVFIALIAIFAIKLLRRAL